MCLQNGGRRAALERAPAAGVGSLGGWIWRVLQVRGENPGGPADLTDGEATIEERKKGRGAGAWMKDSLKETLDVSV